MVAPAKTRGLAAPFRDLAWFVMKYGGRSDLLATSENPPDVTDRADEHLDKAEELACDLESMGPTFIKLGQLLSTRADLLPRPYLEALGRLQDAVESFPFTDVEDIVQTELGVRLSKAFLEFDPRPLAAASLGQVHRAVLRSGREVAVKVQRPGLRERVIEDLAALEKVAGSPSRADRSRHGRTRVFTRAGGSDQAASRSQ